MSSLDLSLLDPSKPADVNQLKRIFEQIQSGLNSVNSTISGLNLTPTAYEQVPIGMVYYWPGPNIPLGYLDCNGQAISRTAYAELFAAIGTFWGAGDGSTTFNVPDARAATIRGVGTPTLYTSNTVITLGQTIDDAFQGHMHRIYQEAGSAPTGVPNNSIAFFGAKTRNASNNAAFVDTYTDGTNGTPRNGLETTGKARGMYAVIKAFNVTNVSASTITVTNRQYLEKLLTVAVPTVSADTYVDVTELALNLTPGKWRIGYQLNPSLRNVTAGALDVGAGVAMKLNGSIMAQSVRLHYENILAGDYATQCMNWETIIDVPTNSTILPAIRCSLAAANVTYTLETTYTASLTEPDLSHKSYAELIEAYIPVTSVTPKEYAYITMSADQVSAGIAAGTTILFDTLSAGNMVFNPATYQVTLKANKTYRMVCACTTTCTAAGYLEPRFYNVTAGASIGTIGEGITSTYASHLAGQPSAFITMTPLVDTIIEVRASAVGGTPTKVQKVYTYWEIEQIN